MRFAFETELQKEELLNKFNKLQSLEEKFDFWDNELKNKYIFYLISTGVDTIISAPNGLNSFHQFHEFRIKPKTKAEFIIYNEVVFKQYEVYLSPLSNQKKISSLSLYTEGFESRIKGIKDKQSYIKQELEKISREIDVHSSANVLFPAEETGSFFKKAFELFYFNNEEFDYSKSFFDYQVLIALHNGKVYGEIKKYLDQELKKVGTKATVKSSTKELSISCLLIISEYMGVIDKLGNADNKQKANFLALFLGKSSQNIREKLSNYSSLTFSRMESEKKKIRKDLKEVLEVLTDLGDKSLISKVERDLQKLDP